MIKLFNYLDRKLFVDQWNIAIVPRPIYSFLNESLTYEFNFLFKPLRNEFYADPFGIFIKNNHYIFYEHFDYCSHRGTINCAEINGKGVKRNYYDIIRIEDHSSYPFILEHEGNVFCIPADLNSNKLTLYQALEFPTKWRNAGDILIDFQAVDPTIIFFKHHWWLFCNNAREGENDTLYAFYSHNIFGPWQPHKKNPIKKDIQSSRPAGTPFIFEDNLFRPAQDCSEDYGQRIIINKIISLTPSDFIEEIWRVVYPPAQLKKYCGVHTISKMNSYTLIDIKQKVFSPGAFINKILASAWPPGSHPGWLG